VWPDLRSKRPSIEADDDSGFGMTLRHRIVNHLAVIGAIARHRATGPRPVEQIRNRRDIATSSGSIPRRQSRLYRRRPPDEVYASGGMTGPVLLVKPFAFAVNLDPGAVDEQMQRLVALNPFR